MVTDDGRIKILDFGVAKLLDTPDSPFADIATTLALTEEGMVVGTTAYMSPEQAEGRHVDPRTDIFSFGSILYELVTGRRPFTGDSRLAVLTKILTQDPQPASTLVPSISPPADTRRNPLRL